jgi:hypothetical protein
MTDSRDEHEPYGFTESPVIARLQADIDHLTAERDEARKEAESWQDDALRMMRDRNTAERERDEAQRECCVRTVDAGGNPAHAPLEEAIAEAKRRGWKCYRTAEDA